MKPGPSVRINWNSPVRVCPSCPSEVGPQPLDAFYRCATRPNGKTSQCKVCIDKRDRNAYRKACVMSAPKDRRAKIKWAITQGARTREAIQAVTRIPWDELCDLLAMLRFDDGELTFDRVTREFGVAA
jgi:hypothetical protein